MGHPKTGHDTGGVKANREAGDNFEDARDSDIDATGVAGSTADEETNGHQSQDHRS